MLYFSCYFQYLSCTFLYHYWDKLTVFPLFGEKKVNDFTFPTTTTILLSFTVKLLKNSKKQFQFLIFYSILQSLHMDSVTNNPPKMLSLRSPMTFLPSKPMGIFQLSLWISVASDTQFLNYSFSLDFHSANILNFIPTTLNIPASHLKFHPSPPDH